VTLEIVQGNIWDYLQTHSIVITTNLGWNSLGSNIMGAGIAKQAAERYPDLPGWYGEVCRKYKTNTPVTRYEPNPIILFPTKGLNEDKPWLSWKQKSSLELIERSTKELASLPGPDKIVLPFPGCQHGQLTREEVLPILVKYLTPDRFTVVDRVVATINF
jgi:hypothetical protein